MASQLARLLDPSELDALTGPHGKMTATLARSQLGEAIAIVVPSRLVCARCEGGGCDSCGRSGAIRLELSEAERTTHVVLPSDTREAVRVRLVRPLGESAGLEQLTLEVRLTGPTSLVVAPPRELALRPALEARSIVIGVVLALAAALVFALTR
jgi:hypothetical protein